MDNDKLKSILKILVIVFIIVLIIYICISNQEETNTIPYSKWSDREKIEYLEEENEKYLDEIASLESQLEELHREYVDAEDLISILREQLESYGIEPDEL